ncbi:MAG: hypothetical protein AB9897_04225 [Anaerolineaceae bacterium]
MNRSSKLILICFIFLCLALSACASAENHSGGSVTYQVAPSFREFYQSLGGEETLGLAISKVFTQDTFECQYTTNALMCLNPLITDSNRFFLYPLGNQFGVAETPSQSPDQNSSQIVDGFTVYDDFLPYFAKFSGEKLTGKPLTQARLNYSQKRIEQYFENVGFYHKFSDPSGVVHLMAYGVFACKSSCDYTASVDDAVSISANAAESQPLLEGLSKMGDTSALGSPLTQPYIAADGMEEQVYTNAVVFAPPNDLKTSNLRQLPILLNMIQGVPGPQKYDSSAGVVFYPVNGINGYHVPLDFDKFIASHGGLEYSGNPIMEVFQYDATIFRQCFEKYCLDYHNDAADGSKVQMAPLGSQYISLAGGVEGNVPQTMTISPDTVVLQAIEAYQKIAVKDEQKIDILVLRKDNQQPVTNVQADLVITLPDKSQYSAAFPKTGLDGRASLIVPAMNNLNNGQILAFEVCLNENVEQPVCTSGSYLIWGVP